MYKLIISVSDKGYEDKGIIRVNTNTAIPFAPANTDYAQFKKAVLDGAELQDAEGVTMSAEQATQFVKELP